MFQPPKTVIPNATIEKILYTRIHVVRAALIRLTKKLTQKDIDIINDATSTLSNFQDPTMQRFFNTVLKSIDPWNDILTIKTCNKDQLQTYLGAIILRLHQIKLNIWNIPQYSIGEAGFFNGILKSEYYYMGMPKSMKHMFVDGTYVRQGYPDIFHETNGQYYMSLNKITQVVSTCHLWQPLSEDRYLNSWQQQVVTIKKTWTKPYNQIPLTYRPLDSILEGPPLEIKTPQSTKSWDQLVLDNLI